MNHRIVTAVVIVIVSLFALAAGLFAWSLQAVTPPHSVVGAAPADPHPPIRQTQDCLECHRVESGTMPVTHRTFTRATCSKCHAASVPVLVPHSVSMGDIRCPECHSDPNRDHGMPRNHLRYTSGQCLLCHPLDSDNYAKTPGPAGLAAESAGTIPHPTNRYFFDCTYCHQVGLRDSLPANHRDFAAETCLDCHRVAAGVVPLD
ncbi:MAG TPA: hypothetical protein VFG89_06290 [Coriobacteriia bacterium]|nr:hypothetical protein [Coriobacteriia bacterium]